MRQRFKNPDMQRLYEAMLTAAADKRSELYLPDGTPHHGAGHRNAFWQGYKFGHIEKPSYIPRNSLAYACFRAGRDWRAKVDRVFWKG